jgi:hypothetical protein
MASHGDRLDERLELTPEEAEALAPLNLMDPAQFLADIRASQEQWEAHRASGKPGLPPGWITAKEYRKQRQQRGVRSDL